MVETVVSALAGAVVLLGAATTLTAAHRFWHETYEKATLQREGSLATYRISRAIRRASSALIENDGKAVRVYTESSWVRFWLDAGGHTLQCQAATPLKLGENNVYYVDGNVWFHSGKTYGFSLSGTATRVATGNIYICDNLQYANSESLMGLVSLGQYSSADLLAAGGNIFFGDPRFGTTYTVSALMFAANDFLYNTDSVTGDPGEPYTGFTIFGNLTALNHVSINRDWYTDSPTYKARPAVLTGSGQWVDAVTGTPLISGEISTIRHYQMKVIYDDRVRDLNTQPPSLPRGGGQIYSGIMSWREL